MSLSSHRPIATCLAGLALATQSAASRAAAAPQSASPIAAFVTAAAQRFAIPEAWIYAVMHVESAGNARAVSPKGATGLMQIMPVTWVTLRARYGLGDDVYDARENLLAGAAYLRELYDRYGAPGVFAAYNAGPLRYEAYLRSGQPLPAETIRYLSKLSSVTGPVSVRPQAVARANPLAWTRSGVFVGGSGTTSFSQDSQSVTAAFAAADPATMPARRAHLDLFVSLSGQQPQ